jgi:hypothetical protein
VSPEAIMDALADVKALLSYTPAYRRVEILNRSDDGRPHRVRLAIRVLDRLGEETSNYIGVHNDGLGCGADQAAVRPARRV